MVILFCSHRSTKAWSFPFVRGTALPKDDREQVSLGSPVCPRHKI